MDKGNLPIPEGYDYLCAALFEKFFQRYQDLKTLDKMEQNITEKFQKELLSEPKYRECKKELDKTRQRLEYFKNMVLKKKLYIYKTKRGEEKWKSIRTPNHYYASINYVIDEFHRIHQVIMQKS